METNARYVIVGLAAVVLIFLTATGLLWLRKSARFKDLNLYTVNFREQSLSGLRGGSIVTMRGMAVGAVQSLEFDKSDSTQVKTVIGVAKSAPVRKNSEASIQRNLVTGLSTIDLSSGSPDMPLIEPTGENDTEYPVLAERANEFESIRDAAPQLMQQSTETLRQFQALLSDENRAQVTQILQNVQSITAKLAAPETGIDKTLADFRAASQELKDASANAGGVFGSLGGTITKLNTTFERVTSMMSESVRMVSERVADMARGVQEATSKISDPRKVLTGPSKNELGPGEEKKR